MDSRSLQEKRVKHDLRKKGKLNNSNLPLLVAHEKKKKRETKRCVTEKNVKNENNPSVVRLKTKQTGRILKTSST